MLKHLLSTLGFMSPNNNATSWEAVQIRQHEDQLFSELKAGVIFNQDRFNQLKTLICNPLFNVNRIYQTDDDYETLLHCVISHHQWEIAQFLLESGITFNEQGLILHAAIQSKQWPLVLLLLENGADLSGQNTRGETALSALLSILPQIAQYGQEKVYVECVNTALALVNLETINLRNNQGQTPLHQLIAGYDTLAYEHHTAFLQVGCHPIDLLLQAGANPYLQDNKGQTALHQYLSKVRECLNDVSQKAYCATFMRLLQHPLTRVNHTDDTGQTVLHLACQRHPYVISMLLTAGADPAQQDHLGNTSLHVYLNHYRYAMSCSVLNALLEKIDIETIGVLNQKGQSALYCFVMQSMRTTCFTQARFIEVLHQLNQAKVLFNAQDNIGNTLLHDVAQSDHQSVALDQYHARLVAVCSPLLVYCSDRPNYYGLLAADIADLMGYNQLVALFSGDQPTVVQQWRQEKQAIIKRVVTDAPSHHADINTSVSSKPCVFFESKKIGSIAEADAAWCQHVNAILNGNSGVKEVLIALLVGCEAHQPKLKQALLSKPQRLLLTLLENQASPLWIALLLKKGWCKNLHDQDSEGNALLHRVMSILQTVCDRLSKERDVSIKRAGFENELSYLQKIVELLLQYGVNPNQQNVKGETPLHQLAAIQNPARKSGFTRYQSRIAAILRDKGAHLELKTEYGQTALDIAKLVRMPSVGSNWDIDIITTLESKNYIDTLSAEMLSNILDQLPPTSLAQVSGVSHRFNRLAQDWLLWTRYLKPDYRNHMKAYIQRLAKASQDEVSTHQYMSGYLQQVIRGAPYSIRSDCLALFFRAKYRLFRKTITSGHHPISNDVIYRSTWNAVDAVIILSHPLLRDRLFKKTTLHERMRPLSFPDAFFDSFETRCLFARPVTLLVLHMPELWEQFIEECKQKVDNAHSLSQVVLSETKAVMLDEELALTCLRHPEFRQYLLQAPVAGQEWLLFIFQQSIHYKLYYHSDASGGEPITYPLVGASLLSTAWFILNDPDYSARLIASLKSNPNSLNGDMHRLKSIVLGLVERPHKGDRDAIEKAKAMLEQLSTLSAQRFFQNPVEQTPHLRTDCAHKK